MTLKQSVYMIRMTGGTVIDYDNFCSPLVYVGRGDTVTRLARHLENWASNVFTWSSDTDIELQIINPSLDGTIDCFKNLEADLLRWFHEKTGMLPLINVRLEQSFEGKVTYKAADERRLRRLLTTGSGKRPRWAIYPLKSNPHYDRYYKHY